ncbi:unnamed protein product [Heligmosomoides polygyrus]|uniref:Uncharacterized protein n=1 Tax=Heligmosomoides polygyrus TaxID=6339 RepID=A0A183GQJ3_HELPZ|nr:unnamed protein product [Heligmosomoides polygyrus]
MLLHQKAGGMNGIDGATPLQGRAALLLPNWDRCTFLPIIRHLLLRYKVVEKLGQQLQGQQNFDFITSAGKSCEPVAFPGLIFLRAASVSSTVILWTGPWIGTTEGTAG